MRNVYPINNNRKKEKKGERKREYLDNLTSIAVDVLPAKRRDGYMRGVNKQREYSPHLHKHSRRDVISSPGSVVIFGIKLAAVAIRAITSGWAPLPSVLLGREGAGEGDMDALVSLQYHITKVWVIRITKKGLE